LPRVTGRVFFVRGGNFEKKKEKNRLGRNMGLRGGSRPLADFATANHIRAGKRAVGPTPNVAVRKSCSQGERRGRMGWEERINALQKLENPRTRSAILTRQGRGTRPTEAVRGRTPVSANRHQRVIRDQGHDWEEGGENNAEKVHTTFKSAKEV